MEQTEQMEQNDNHWRHTLSSIAADSTREWMRGITQSPDGVQTRLNEDDYNNDLHPTKQSHERVTGLKEEYRKFIRYPNVYVDIETGEILKREQYKELKKNALIVQSLVKKNVLRPEWEKGKILYRYQLIIGVQILQKQQKLF